MASSIRARVAGLGFWVRIGEGVRVRVGVRVRFGIRAGVTLWIGARARVSIG